MLAIHMGLPFQIVSLRVSSQTANDVSVPYRALCVHIAVRLRLRFDCQLSFQNPLHRHVLAAIACGLSLILTPLPAPLPLLLHSCRTEKCLFTFTATLTCSQWAPFPLRGGMRNPIRRGKAENK